MITKNMKTKQEKRERVELPSGEVIYITESDFNTLAESNTIHECDCCGEVLETIKIRRNANVPDRVLITKQQFYSDKRKSKLSGEAVPVADNNIIGYLLENVDYYSGMKLLGQMPIVYNW